MALTLDQKLEVVARLEGLGVKAIAQLERVLDEEEDSSVILRAAEAILDRIGFGRQSRQEIAGQVDLGIIIHHRFPALADEQEPLRVTHREEKGL